MLSLPLLFFECCLLLFFLPFTTALQTFLQPRSPRAYSFYHNHYRFPEKSLTSPSCLYASLVEGEDGFIDNRDNGIPKKQFTSRPNDLIVKMQKIMKDKGFSKASIAKLGGYALLSYGFVSNVSYITCIIISWVIHGRVNKLSPLAAGQWKPFLAIYAGRNEKEIHHIL